MLCLVNLPDNKIFEILVDNKESGQACLDQVCKKLDIISVDYFGLQYRGANGELLWLNMKNQLRSQMRGHPPFTLALRVKFFVQPQYLLQDSTRHQFYLNVKAHILDGLVSVDEEQAAQFAALMAQTELGDCPQGQPLQVYSAYLPPCWQENLQPTVQQKHRELRGTRSRIAKYLLLKEAAILEEELGVQCYSVKSTDGDPLHLRVGPRGLTVIDQHNTVQHSILYSSILSTTREVNFFILKYIGADKNSGVTVKFKQNVETACAIYRAVIENHVFYSCETVRDAVKSQFIRNLKGVVASLFNDKSEIGKTYIFDVQRTFREIYDYTSRILHEMKAQEGSGATIDGVKETMHCESRSCKSEREKLKLQLNAIQDSVLCRVCMDSEISAVFFPCSHAVCCYKCAALVQMCPVCRASIDNLSRIFLSFHKKF